MWSINLVKQPYVGGIFQSDMYSLNSAKRTRRHYFYSFHMKWRLTCVVFVVFVFLIIVFVIGGWKSPICERPCVQINLSNIWWIPWGWTNLGALDFHYENGYRATKMHLNTSQPRVPWNLAEHFSLSWPFFVGLCLNLWKMHFSHLSLKDHWGNDGMFFLPAIRSKQHS